MIAYSSSVLFRLILFLLATSLMQEAHALTVFFLNPGKSDEAYWDISGKSMEVAAKELGIHFEMQYAERDHMRELQLAQDLAKRPPAQRPDYAIFTNDYAMGPELLRLFDSAGIRTLVAYSGLSGVPDRNAIGPPRLHFKGWIGSIEPHSEDAGYMTAQALMAEGKRQRAYGRDGKLHMIAISGDRSTTTSIRRSAGMKRALAETNDTVLDQEVFGEWNRLKAASQADVLFKRYPDARLIWAGNDLMSFGAMDAWEQRGGRPGKDAWFSAINTSREAMQMLILHRLTALSGGHFIAGACALVMIYDYEHGHDFVDEGLELDQSMFSLFDANLANLYLNRFDDTHMAQIDFRQFSKTLNPRIKRYNFNFQQLLHSSKP